MIDILAEETIVYHDSFVEVVQPDLARCAKYKDFGRGFYVTTDRDQAVSFARLSMRKAIQNGLAPADQDYGVVSSFVYHGQPALRMKIFPEADAAWLECVVAHRKQGTFSDVVDSLAEMDMIGGKIANDNTNATINAYMSGTFGELDSPAAQEMCISLLLVERLRDQYCFRSDRALNCLVFQGSWRV